MKNNKTQTVTIFGASDDLIELEGDLLEEFSFSSYDEENAKLAFSDGTVLSILYDDEGCWRVNRLITGTAHYEKKEADGPDTDNYTDRVTLIGDLKWCLFGNGFVKNKFAHQLESE